MKITHREQLEVLEQVKRDLSWKCFREYVVSQHFEKKNQVRSLSSNFNALLEREQLQGQVFLLESILEDFHSHVVNVITTNKETQDNANAE